LLTAIFLAGTIAGLGGALAARFDRLDTGKVAEARRALSSLVDTVAWSEDAIAAPAGAPAASFALERGDEAMRLRDVIAARRFYEFAASAGVAGAATALARTYDPLYLQQLGIRGVKPDTEAALRWYKRASAEGDPAARPR